MGSNWATYNMTTVVVYASRRKAWKLTSTWSSMYCSLVRALVRSRSPSVSCGLDIVIIWDELPLSRYTISNECFILEKMRRSWLQLTSQAFAFYLFVFVAKALALMDRERPYLVICKTTTRANLRIFRYHFVWKKIITQPNTIPLDRDS